MKTLGIVLAIALLIAIVAAPLVQEGVAWREAAHHASQPVIPPAWDAAAPEPAQAVPAIPVTGVVSHALITAVRRGRETVLGAMEILLLGFQVVATAT